MTIRETIAVLIVAAYTAAPMPLPQPRDFAPTGDCRDVGDYAVCFDGRTRQPRYVVEVLTKRHLTKNSDRTGESFRVDRDVPAEFRPSPDEYAGTGNDLGHQAAAANHQASPELLAETFTMSNVCPQKAAFNRGKWKHLEAHVRAVLAEPDVDLLVVISGPLFLPADETTTCINVDTFGKSRIWTPTHFLKAVCVYRGESVTLATWILPNADCGDRPLTEFAVSVDDAEYAAGLDLWAFLPDRDEKRLEAVK